MRKIHFLLPIWIFCLILVSTAFSADTSDPIVLYRLGGEGNKEIRHDFAPGEKIYADFTFLPEGEQTSVEFRWINPLNKKEQVYSEIVRSSKHPQKQTVLCWLYLPTAFSDRFVGSKYFGRWLLEVWVNNRRTATKTFSVGN